MTTTNAPSSSTQNQKYQGIDIHSFGMRILKKQGWQEGTGLGPNKSGLKKHLHASRREHNAGLGTDRRDNTGVVGADWTRNAKNFESVLKGLEDYKKEDKNDDGNDDGDKMDKKKDKKEKKEKKNKRKKKESEYEEEEEMDVPERPRSAVGHAGRYHKREREKMRDYSYEDLNAILGGGAFGGLEEVRANNDDGATADADRNDSDGSNGKKIGGDSTKDDDEKKKKKEKKSSKKEKKNESSKNNTKEGSPLDEMMTVKFTFPPKPKDWWGHSFGFCQEGCGKDNDDSRFKYAAKTQTHVVSALGRLKIPFRKAIKELALKSAPVLEEVNRFISYRILEILDELHGNDVHQAAVFEKLSGLYANDKVIKALVKMSCLKKEQKTLFADAAQAVEPV